MNARRRIATVVLSIVCVGMLASTAFADCNYNGSTAGWLLLWSQTGSTSPYQKDCRMDPGVDVVIVQISGNPFQRVQLTVADPPFGKIVGEHWYFPSTGNRVTGVELDMGGCTAAGATTQLGEIYVSVDYSVANPFACAAWASGTAQIQNCSGRWLPASYTPIFMSGIANLNCPYLQCWQCPASTPAYNLLPLDGATNVPLDTDLSWVGIEFGWNCRLWVSSDPTCATGQDMTPPQCAHFDPGPLSPNTTYYWRVSWAEDCCWGAGATTAIHSFKTAGLVATTPSTWGRVKSMYRE